MWLPDTNVWIAYLRKKPSPVHLRISNLPESQLWLCDVVKAELYFGAFKSARSAENLERLERLFSILPSVPFDSAAARQFGEIRAYLSRRGMPIGPYDLQIAAIAALHDFTLVTHNIGEFSRVPGLRLEDWEQ